MGLLLSHKRKLTIWNDMMSVSGLHDNEQSGGGKRGEIEVFSAGSRYRLFRLLHQLTFRTITFVTLTYPAAYPEDPKIYKANLKEFHRKFEVKWRGIQAVWRLEFQARGAPHFHIMFLDCLFIEIGELLWMWKCTCHTWDMAHELLGVDLKLITDNTQQKLIASYLGKYIAKIDERTLKNDTKHCGRWWGKWNINEPTPVEFEISDWQAERITTFLLDARMGGKDWRPLDPTLCTVFGNHMGGNFFGEFVRRYKDSVGSSRG